MATSYKAGLEQALKQDLIGPRGEPRTISLAAPMSLSDILEFEGTLPGPLPRPVRELLGLARGFELPRGVEVSFVRRRPAEWGAFCDGVKLAERPGAGFWVVDIRDGTGEWGPVFFISRRPPVVLVQAADLAEFIEQALGFGRAARGDGLEIADRFARRIWSEDPWTMSRRRAARSADSLVAGFASSVRREFRIADLRSAEVGSGFVYARRRGEPALVRCRPDLLFGVERTVGRRVQAWLVKRVRAICRHHDPAGAGSATTIARHADRAVSGHGLVTLSKVSQGSVADTHSSFRLRPTVRDR